MAHCNRNTAFIYNIFIRQSPVTNVSRYIFSVETVGKTSLISNVRYMLQTLIVGRNIL